MRVGTWLGVGCLAVACAHAPPAPPTLAARTLSVWFDRGSYGDVRGTSLVHAEDGTWRGVVLCPERVPVEIATTEEGLALRQRRYPVTTTSEETMVQELSGDLVFRRSDGGPVPSDLVVPLMLLLDSDAFCLGREPQPRRLVVGVWLDVEGIGRVEAFRAPPGQGPLYFRRGNAHPRPVTLVAAQ